MATTRSALLKLNHFRILPTFESLSINTPIFSRLRAHLHPDKLRPYLLGWSPASSSEAGRAYLEEGGYRETFTMQFSELPSLPGVPPDLVAKFLGPNCTLTDLRA